MKFFSEQLPAITFLLFSINFTLIYCAPASSDKSEKGPSKPPAFHQKEQRFIQVAPGGTPLSSVQKNINQGPMDRFPQNYGGHGSKVTMKFDRNTGGFVGEKAKPFTKAQSDALHQSLSSAVKEARQGSHSGLVSPTRAGSVSPRRESVSPRRASPKLLATFITMSNATPVNGARPPRLNASGGRPVQPKTVGDHLQENGVNLSESRPTVKSMDIDPKARTHTYTTRPMTEAEKHSFHSTPFHESGISYPAERPSNKFKVVSSPPKEPAAHELRAKSPVKSARIRPSSPRNTDFEFDI